MCHKNSSLDYKPKKDNTTEYPRQRDPQTLEPLYIA
jgi:hypothetical protein